MAMFWDYKCLSCKYYQKEIRSRNCNGPNLIRLYLLLDFSLNKILVDALKIVESIFVLESKDTKISSLLICISNVRFRLVCAQICNQQKEFCVGFQYGTYDKSCCPLNFVNMQTGLRQSAAGYALWRLALD